MPSATQIIFGYIKHLTLGSFLLTIIYFMLYPLYNAIYDKLSSYPFMDDAYIFALGVSCTHITFYWTINLFFLYCDIYKVMQKYKIPRSKSQKVSKELIYKTLKQALFGQLIMEPLGGIFILWPSFKYYGCEMRYTQPPTFFYVFSMILFSEFLMGWIFYFAHRLFHHPLIYGRFHKQHHEYTGSMSIAAEYANPIEGLFANLYSTMAGCLHSGAHPLVFYVYLFWRLWDTYETHSGYSFRGTFLYKIGLTSGDHTLYHDFHHSNNIGNYAARFHDWVCGTDVGFDKWLDEWNKKHKND